MTREARLAEPAADLGGQLVLRRAGHRARRAEDRHGAVHVGQLAKAHRELGGHPLDALGVGDLVLDAGVLGADQLLVGRGGSARCASGRG